jgi:hypothetical protein
MSITPETRQTLIGCVALTVVEAVAVLEGFNGNVAAVYVAGIIAMVAPVAKRRALPAQEEDK